MTEELLPVEQETSKKFGRGPNEILADLGRKLGISEHDTLYSERSKQSTRVRRRLAPDHESKKGSLNDVFNRLSSSNEPLPQSESLIDATPHSLDNVQQSPQPPAKQRASKLLHYRPLENIQPKPVAKSPPKMAEESVVTKETSTEEPFPSSPPEEDFVPPRRPSTPSRKRTLLRSSRKPTKKKRAESSEVITLDDSEEEPDTSNQKWVENVPTQEFTSRYQKKSCSVVSPRAVCTSGKLYFSPSTSQEVYLLSSKLVYQIEQQEHSLNYTESEWVYGYFGGLYVLTVKPRNRCPDTPVLEDSLSMIFPADVYGSLLDMTSTRPHLQIDRADFTTTAESSQLLDIASLFQQCVGEDTGTSTQPAVRTPKPSSGARTRQQRRKRRSQNNEVILVWPPPPQREAVSVLASDLDLLEPEEFLNDTIIDFYLKYIQQRCVVEPDTTFHFFNCFVYKMIAGSASSSSSVVKWGADADILSKDYLILPVNECMHWLLAIVCFPREAITNSSDSPADLTENLVDEESRRPAILLFDSMSKLARSSKITTHIRRYLTRVYEVQNPDSEFHFTRHNLPLQRTNVPQQSNGSDCGLFLLHYVEKFCANPHWDATKFTRGWFSQGEITTKRESIRSIIEALQVEMVSNYVHK